MKLQTSSWFTPSPQPASSPARGLLLIAGFRPQGPPACRSAQTGGQRSGCQTLRRAGRKPAPTSGHWVVTHCALPHTGHREDEGPSIAGIHFKASQHRPLAGPFQIPLPACPTATVNVFQLLRSTKTSSMECFSASYGNIFTWFPPDHPPLQYLTSHLRAPPKHVD